MPAVTAATPKPCRSPLGEAGTPSSPAACITACTARQPVIRAPRPEAHAAAFAAPCVQFANAVHHVEGIEQGRGYGHAAKNPGAALFEAFEHQHAGGEIDPVGGQRQGFGEPAAGIRQGHAECPHRAVGQVGFAQEGIALAGGQIFSDSVGGMQLREEAGDIEFRDWTQNQRRRASPLVYQQQLRS